MLINFFRSAIFAVVMLPVCPVAAFAQRSEVTAIDQPLRSTNIIIERFEWAFSDSLKGTSQVKITITNKSKLAVKSITVSLTGQTKKGIMLQSGNTHTIKRKTALEKIMPAETRTIIIPRAFDNRQLYTLLLKEVTIEYENSSLEMLK